MTAVDDAVIDLPVDVAHPDVDERRPRIADAVLEGVFDEDDQQQRRYGDVVRQVVRVVEPDIHVFGVADAHQFDVVLHELDVLLERNGLVPRFVEDVTHHLRQLDHGVLRIGGVDVDQRVDVVERVHEEMGVDLVFEIIHFGLEVLSFELLHGLLVAQRLVHHLDGGVGAGHEESQHDVPVDGQVGERRVFGADEMLRRGEVAQYAVEDVDAVEDRRDEEHVDDDVTHVLVALDVAHDEGVVDDEDEQIGGDLLPCDQDVGEADVHLGHHLRVEDGHEQNRQPDHDVEQVFADFLFLVVFHDGQRYEKSSAEASVSLIMPRRSIYGAAKVRISECNVKFSSNIAEREYLRCITAWRRLRRAGRSFRGRRSAARASSADFVPQIRRRSILASESLPNFFSG